MGDLECHLETEEGDVLGDKDAESKAYKISNR